MGETHDILKLGRTTNRVVEMFHHPDTAEGQDLLKDVIKMSKQKDYGLEFVYSWSPKKCTILVLIPVAASIAAIIGWVVTYRDSANDHQITIQTAFSIATYIVTTSIP